VIAYKFLGEGAHGLYSGFAWPVGEWVEVEPPLVPARRGVHACTAESLPYWLDDELWLTELDGETVERETMVVAERGRLLKQVEGWGPDVLHELAAVSLARRCHDAALLEDAAFWGEPISTVYMAAHSAGLESERAGRGYEAGYASERAAQAAWLAGRLGLVGDRGSGSGPDDGRDGEPDGAVS
jgi:hypothetical protein